MNGKLRWGLAVGVVGTAVLLWFVPNFALRQTLAFTLLALWPILTGVFLFEGGWLARMVSAGGLALLGQIFVALLVHYLPGEPPRILLLAGMTLVCLLPLFFPAKPLPKLPAWRTKYGWLLAAALVLFVLLRWPNLGYKEFQGDEGIIMARAAAMLTGDDAELFLHQKGPVEILLPFLLWGVGGEVTEFWVRLPFWWASLLMVGALVWLGRCWFSPLIGLLAGLLFALNGFGVAFSRIVQYQSFVMLWGTLAVVFADLYRENGRAYQLWLTAVFLAGGLLAHYDAILVLPVIIWLVWPRFMPISRLAWRDWAGGLLLGAGLLGLFYVPFLLNPNFGRTGSYLLGDRLGGSLLSWSGPQLWQMTVFYNSIYYVAGMIILLVAAIWLKNGRTYSRVAAWLYFLVPLFFYLFIVADPRTHLYTFFPGAAVLAAVGLVNLDRWFRGRGTAVLRIGYGLLILFVLASALYPFLLFVDMHVERQRNWAELRPAGYLTNLVEPPLFGLFGFPYQAGWRAVAQLPLVGPIASNEEEEITNVYLGPAARTFCPDANTFILAENVQDSVPYDPALFADWDLQYQVMVNGRNTMRIYSRQPVAATQTVEVGDARLWLGETAVAQPTYTPSQSLNTFLGTRGNDEVQLIGYDISDTNAHPGGEITLTLYWKTLTPISKNYQVFVHLVRDELLSQNDSTPECGVNPTIRWEPGQVILDTHIIPINLDVRPGLSVIKIGMYDLETLDRMAIEGESDNSLTLTEVIIKP
ncbi:MAG: glycosyltransferase family 39 protein [Ardenticatenaceae bacterium]|nr:glycosyltransferase family 39 protein [Ardenticatenaceae bacterium]